MKRVQWLDISWELYGLKGLNCDKPVIASAYWSLRHWLISIQAVTYVLISLDNNIFDYEIISLFSW